VRESADWLSTTAHRCISLLIGSIAQIAERGTTVRPRTGSVSIKKESGYDRRLNGLYLPEGLLCATTIGLSG
jgi:hypothetical protein